MSAPEVKGVIETAIYVEDTQRSAEFYTRVLGLRQMTQSERLAAMSVNERSVLLLFKKGGSRQATVFEGGSVPPNDAVGQIHFALAISPDSFEEWQKWLSSQGVEIESIVRWGRGGRSIYFRDPDGQNVELVTPGIWDMY